MFFNSSETKNVKEYFWCIVLYNVHANYKLESVKKKDQKVAVYIEILDTVLRILRDICHANEFHYTFWDLSFNLLTQPSN